MTAIEQIGQQCTGCGACIAICPVSALTMVQDAEGFFYPQVDQTKCTNCGLCNRSCPIANPSLLVRTPLPEQALAGSLKDKKLLSKSASGGAFMGLVAALEPDVVYGAAWESPSSVALLRTTPDRLNILQGSKYIQARTGQVFLQVKDDLQAGKQVLFSGTPCQIAGLQSFLGKQSRKNLTTIELICHGVASPGLWAAYLQSLEESSGVKIAHINFREKTGWLGTWEAYQTVLTDQNGVKSRSQNNPFTSLFLNRTILRPCCGSCPYATSQRLADLVIGDYWGCSKRNPELYNRFGISLIFPITEKGRVLAGKLPSHMNVKEIPTTHATPGNRSLREPRSHSPAREDFFSIFITHGAERALNTYAPPQTWKKKLKPYLRPFLSKLRG